MQKLKEGDVFHVVFTISESDMQAFATLSGDTNAIHCDDAYAISYGMKDRVVYGGLILASVSRLIGMELGGSGWVWQSVSAQFKNPLYLGQSATTTAKVSYASHDLGVYRLKFDVRTDHSLIAQGDAQVGKLTPRGSPSPS